MDKACLRPFAFIIDVPVWHLVHPFNVEDLVVTKNL
jgi:hypothetical protein